MDWELLRIRLSIIRAVGLSKMEEFPYIEDMRSFALFICLAVVCIGCRQTGYNSHYIISNPIEAPEEEAR